MTKRPVMKLIVLLAVLIVTGALLLVAQTSGAPDTQSNKTAVKGQKSGKAAPGSTPTAKRGEHKLGIQIPITITNCMASPPMVHADRGDQITFSTTDSETYFVFLQSDKLFGLTEQVLRVDKDNPQPATVRPQGNPSNPTTYKYWVAGCTCTSKSAKSKTHPLTSDPNDVIVP